MVMPANTLQEVKNVIVRIYSCSVFRFYNYQEIEEHHMTNTLTLRNVTKDQSGRYKCRANNDVSAVYSDAATLTVKGWI